MANLKKIILYINPGKGQAAMVGRELLAWFAGRAEVVAHNIGLELDLGHPRSPADFVVVLGGDGTILSTVRALGRGQVPIIGVNMGKLGFLAEFSLEQFKEEFAGIMQRTNGYIERTMLTCKISGPGRESFQTLVVNEVTITSGPPFRMITVAVHIADELLANCAGDGLIVSTPTGSTAYNLSAGGPILASTLTAAVITPLAAHSLSFRPVVVDLNKPIRLTCRQADQTTAAKGAVIVIDGQIHMPLHPEDDVMIGPAQTKFMLVQNPRQSQWRLLNNKLNWGALPNYLA